MWKEHIRAVNPTILWPDRRTGNKTLISVDCADDAQYFLSNNPSITKTCLWIDDCQYYHSTMDDYSLGTTNNVLLPVFSLFYFINNNSQDDTPLWFVWAQCGLWSMIRQQQLIIPSQWERHAFTTKPLDFNCNVLVCLLSDGLRGGQFANTEQLLNCRASGFQFAQACHDGP